VLYGEDLEHYKKLGGAFVRVSKRGRLLVLVGVFLFQIYFRSLLFINCLNQLSCLFIYCMYVLILCIWCIVSHFLYLVGEVAFVHQYTLACQCYRMESSSYKLFAFNRRI